MHFNEKTRRQFLRGAALALPLPVLPSLLPRPARAAGLARPPLRFLHCLHVWNQFGSTFYPQGLTMQTLDAESGVKGAPLAGVQGPLSKVVGSAFDPIRNKMSMVRGLHVLTGNGNHNTSKPTCASGSPAGDPTKPPVPYSIESILSNSSKVYPNGAAGGTERFLGVVHRRPKFDSRGLPDGWAWTPTGKMATLTSPAAAFSKFMGSFNKTFTDPKTDPRQLARINVMDDVYQDFKATSAGGRISADDRMRLEAYATLIAEVKTKLGTPDASCSMAPTLSTDGTTDSQAKDMVNLVAAVMACQLTNVIDFAISPEENGGGGSYMHTFEHDGKIPQYSDNTAEYGKIYGSLWSKLDQLKDADGRTVLDNTIAAWCTSEGLDVAHSEKNMPLVIAGGADYLKAGYYLDFGNRPYNNWLVTIMTAFGLEAADYEKGQVGIGEYNAATATKYGVAGALLTDSEKRKPLPFLFKGA